MNSGSSRRVECSPKENPVPAKTRFLNPDALTKPAAYSQVVEVTTPGRMIFISGQIGVGGDGKLVGGDFRAQAMQVFENLKFALEAVGARFEDVVKMNSYIIEIEHQAILRDVRKLYMNMAAPPASTSVRVGGFAREGVLLEVEAVAVLPE
jgi:enamine deaminase RidA (YjgF/YER057c/UK114 family)